MIFGMLEYCHFYFCLVLRLNKEYLRCTKIGVELRSRDINSDSLNFDGVSMGLIKLLWLEMWLLRANCILLLYYLWYLFNSLIVTHPWFYFFHFVADYMFLRYFIGRKLFVLSLFSLQGLNTWASDFGKSELALDFKHFLWYPKF